MKTILLLVSIMFVSCSTRIIPDGYSGYQTFDEYQLRGILVDAETVKSPSVYIKQTEDTIWVIESEDNKEQKYIKNDKYWYCSVKQKTYIYPDCKCDTTALYIEKFILNDTVLTVSYYKNGEEIYNEGLQIETNTKLVRIEGVSLNVNVLTDSLFNKVKLLADNYRKMIPYYKRGDNYQPCYYESYTKKIKNNRLYLYKNDESEVKKCLKDVFSMNSLGEYDPDLYKRSIYDMKQNEFENETRCE